VNEAPRIEGKCKALEQNILLSADFANHFPNRLVSLDMRTLPASVHLRNSLHCHLPHPGITQHVGLAPIHPSLLPDNPLTRGEKDFYSAYTLRQPL